MKIQQPVRLSKINHKKKIYIQVGRENSLTLKANIKRITDGQNINEINYNE